MIGQILPYFLVQIETVGPEGGKILWAIPAILLITGITLIIKNREKIHLPEFRSSLKVSLNKNAVYHPTIITLEILNKSKKAVTIQNPVIRFRKGRRTKAFKIKAVNSSQIYPLFLEAGKTHVLPVSLQPFYDFDKKLKRLSRVRIEFKYDDHQAKSSKYVLLKPTLFRKAKR